MDRIDFESLAITSLSIAQMPGATVAKRVCDHPAHGPARARTPCAVNAAGAVGGAAILVAHPADPSFYVIVLVE